jgi:hypothetical protein
VWLRNDIWLKLSMAKSSFGFFLCGDLVYSMNLSHGKEKYFYKKLNH